MAETMAIDSLDSHAPYEQQPGESAAHFAWFHAFLEMGPGRSVRAAFASFHPSAPDSPKKPQVSASWKAASNKWNWRGRAGAWDAVQREKRLHQIGEREHEIIDRIFAGIEKQLEQREKVDKLADFILSFPLTEQTIDVTGTQVVIRPASWTMDTGIRAFIAIGKANKDALELVALLGELERANIFREAATATNWQTEPDGAARDGAATLPPTARREAENARLDALDTLAVAQAMQGVPGALECALRISQRRASLNGLDKPFDPQAEKEPKRRRDLDGFSDVELSILEEMMQGEEAEIFPL
jgi:hypothetical protein